jgi:hypothetical protein
MVNRWLTGRASPGLEAVKAGAGSIGCGIIRHCGQGTRPMTDEQLADLHRLLAEYHRRLGKEAVLDVVQQYHSDLAQRLADEAALIPRRTAIVERLHVREQQMKDDGE